jgi:hypothetical protein
MMTVTNEQRKALKAVAAQATEAAELIRQRDQAPIDHPFRDPPRRELRPYGPDQALQDIERQLKRVASAIDYYLAQPPGG